MKKIMSIFGTRPEAIKMAPVVKELEKHPDKIESVVCLTGQHREMLKQVLLLFEIVPDIDLHLMKKNQTLASLTALAITGLTKIISEIKPDLVLVQGDTTTAMVGSLAGFYQEIPIGHIEAGLRTYDRYSPFPEEINRRLISVLASYSFAPTQTAANALIAEGVSKENIFITGNTVIDALHMTLKNKHQPDFGVPLHSDKVILVTAHRRENVGDSLHNICLALREIAKRNPKVEIVFPVHLNPRVHEPVHHMLSNEERIYLIPPLDYRTFAHLMNRSYLVLTDSGGIQEEAPALGKPVLVMRRETERPEAMEAGAVKVIGTETESIVANTELLLHNSEEYNRMSRLLSPYGDGHAAERIVKIILGPISTTRSTK